MTKFAIFTLALTGALSLSAAHAQQKMDDMPGMDMKGMTMSPPASAQKAHKTTALVKKVDPEAGTVTLSHEPIKSLNWPAMTMAFKVKDKALFDKLADGKRVEVELTQEGKDYVVTKVR